ncbi:hypothetical protein QQF64_023939 [Cirrhinus molitorella]|uniref:Uncharacterized protein n=1 Tax=Cirrhinus molitorella TaxID=172907 RepID=A0ABR3NKP5_9TELE
MYMERSFWSANDNAGKMNLYAETFSKVVNLNLCPFFKAWGWPIQPRHKRNISHLTEWSDHPMVQSASKNILR